WNTPSFKPFYLQFLVFSGYQGALQLLLNRYQQSRLYKQRALGKATRIDVAAEHELVADRGGSSYGCAPTLMMLLPAILGAHIFQFYNSATLFSSVYDSWYQELPVEWQPILLGFFFLIVAVGNVYSTIEVYYQKWRSTSRSATPSR
ncbi:MAG: hypothetical protein K2Z81_20510, partial [Cyanobacteria bacterium]|nr:hypothetical protein [Cyanobacteriota bacterium]